jgi:hypothetical protein
MFGYDTFVLDDNQYDDSFYSNMADSIQIKKNTQAPRTEQVKVEPQLVSSFSSRYSKSDYMYQQEIEKLRFQIIIFFILLVSAVFVIITQKATICAMQQILLIVKPGMSIS